MSRTRVVTGLRARLSVPVKSVVTIGVFDGVHRAHQRLIRTAVREARRMRGMSVAVTFDPDPHAVLDPRHAPPSLMPLTERARRMSAFGLDRIWIIPFTRSFAALSARQFIRRILANRLRAGALVVGEDFAFGRGRQGDLRLLRETGIARGLRVVAVKQVRYQGEPVSSSRIRRELSAGRLGVVTALLGRRPAIYGVVVRGAGRGRRLGFPTANLRLSSRALPPRGVYAVRVTLFRRPSSRGTWNVECGTGTGQGFVTRSTLNVSREHGFPRIGVMNLGVRPTFGPGPLICEVHLPGFSGTLLGRSLAVELLARLRGERCFSSLAAFRRQVRHDLARARRVFSRSK